MAVNENKIYEIKLNNTGSGVTPTDTLRLQLSGSNSANFVDVSISGSVTEWQSGQEISGSTLIAAYEAAVTSSPETVFAARLKNESGVCNGETSEAFIFPEGEGVFCSLFAGNLSFSTASFTAACNEVSGSSGYYTNNGLFDESTQFLYEDNSCNPADPGFYSTGSFFVEISGSEGQVIDSGSCQE